MHARENLRSIFVLLFLEIALFFLQMQDPERYVQIFSFDRASVMAGEVWRIFTYQFMQGGSLSLFFSLLILYIMGGALEEEWGTFDFIAFYLLSVLGSAGVAFALGFPLIGSFFLSYSLLFAFAASYPERTFYLFFVLPVKVKWLAWIAAAFLLLGIVMRQPPSIAAAGGTALSLAWFWMRHGRHRAGPLIARRPKPLVPERPPIQPGEEMRADENLALFERLDAALRDGDTATVAAVRRELGPRVVQGVNICPPPDYKPAKGDRYCIRCEGFAECSIRYADLSEQSSADAVEARR